MLDQVVALVDGYHELRAEQPARPNQTLHAIDELGKRAMVVGTVVPRTARPDCVARDLQGLALKEVLLYNPYAVVEFFEFEPVDQARRVGVIVTREVDLATVQGDRVAFDGDDAVSGGGERQDELAVARADDRDGGVRGNPLPQRGEEPGEEGEGVLPQALCLHGSVLLACRWRGSPGGPRRG